MARKIIEHLFQTQEGDSSTEKTNNYVSIKDWKTLVSRLDRIQIQMESCNEKVDLTHSKIMLWFSCMREKLESVCKKQKQLDSSTKQMFKQWEKKIMEWVQPEQRVEDQRKVMDLMQRHSQFIQSYDQKLNSLKSALSKNEYQLYQMLEQMRTVRIEMDLMNRNNHQNHQNINQRHNNQELSLL